MLQRHRRGPAGQKALGRLLAPDRQHRVVLEPANARGRVLVRFDKDVAALGLTCHNPELNSLLIAESDLAAIT